MKMKAEHRAIDKIFRRRDRYEIPDWQRGEVWDRAKKQRLVDSILRGWKLPKFYFVGVSEEDYLVEDGQQRLAAIFDFFSNELPLSPDSVEEFGGPLYRNLRRKVAESFDDFEIEYDIIEDATDEELKEFFLRLQEGMSLNSSEKLNAVHSKLRDYCRSTSKHLFFRDAVAVPNTRYAHFDIMAKVATIEIEGLDAGLRLEDVKQVFSSQSNFAPTSAVAKRIRSALDFLHAAFKSNGSSLRTRTIVQSLITLACRLVATGRSKGLESQLRKFLETFTTELAEQVEMGQRATDSDYLTFQHSVNANVKGGAKTRQEILLRKLFRIAPELADIFDPSIVAESGVSGRIVAVADSIAQLVEQLTEQQALGQKWRGPVQGNKQDRAGACANTKADHDSPGLREPHRRCLLSVPRICRYTPRRDPAYLFRPRERPQDGSSARCRPRRRGQGARQETQGRHDVCALCWRWYSGHH